MGYYENFIKKRYETLKDCIKENRRLVNGIYNDILNGKVVMLENRREFKHILFGLGYNFVCVERDLEFEFLRNRVYMLYGHGSLDPVTRKDLKEEIADALLSEFVTVSEVIEYNSLQYYCMH